MYFHSTSDALTWLYSQSLNETSFQFRGQSNAAWTLQPSIYRYENFKRYQAVLYENLLLKSRPLSPMPPLTHTVYDLEWLMLCQHYGIPTRLLDWTSNILIALFFACYGESEKEDDGILYVCNQNDYPQFNTYNEKLMHMQELSFVNTYIVNPRMQSQSGSFMMWGHSPLDNKVPIMSYDLHEYNSKRETPYSLTEIHIPKKAKQKILSELKDIYSISYDSIYLQNGYLERKYSSQFEKLKEHTRLETLYKTDANILTKGEQEQANSMFGNCKNMFGSCTNLRMIDITN